MDYVDQRASVAATNMGISINSTQLSTAIQNVTLADRLIYRNHPFGHFAPANVTARFNLGDQVRAHTDGGALDVSSEVNFRMTKIGN